MQIRFDENYPSIDNYRKAHNDQRFWGLLNEETGECYLHPGCLDENKPLFVTEDQKKAHVTYGAKNDQFFVVFSGVEADGLGNIIIPLHKGDGGGHKIFLEKMVGEGSPDSWRGFSLTKTEDGPSLIFRSVLNKNDANNREMLEPTRSHLKRFLDESLKKESLQQADESIVSNTPQHGKSANSPRFFSSRTTISIVAGVGIIVTAAYLLSPKKSTG